MLPLYSLFLTARKRLIDLPSRLSGRPPPGSRSVPLAARLHHQDRAAGAAQAHAAQGQHEAVAAAGGGHLLKLLPQQPQFNHDMQINRSIERGERSQPKDEELKELGPQNNSDRNFRPPLPQTGVARLKKRESSSSLRPQRAKSPIEEKMFLVIGRRKEEMRRGPEIRILVLRSNDRCKSNDV